MAATTPLFDTLTSSEVRIFQNNSVSLARGLTLLKRSVFTEDNVKEFATTVKLMIKSAMSSDNLAFKNQIEIFDKKLAKSFATKRVHKSVGPDFLLLSQHITEYLPLTESLPPLKDYSSDEDSDSETPPTMTAFDVTLEGGSKPTASRARSDSPIPIASSSRDRTRSRSPLPSKERSRSPTISKEKSTTNRGEKSKKTKRSFSGSSSAGETEVETRSDSRDKSSKKRCLWNDLTFSLAKKIKGKYF